MRLAAAALLSALLVLGAGAAQAVPGNLDPSFGSGGVAATRIGSSASAQALALQPDGKIVEAGWSVDGTDGVFALARYAPDGTLDRSFGSNGTTTTAWGTHAQGEAVALQPDGKIVVAGQIFYQAKFALARYTPDGSLDPELRRKRQADVPGRGGERRGRGRGPARRQDRRRRLQLQRRELRYRTRPAQAERIAGSRVRDRRPHDHAGRPRLRRGGAPAAAGRQDRRGRIQRGQRTFQGHPRPLRRRRLARRRLRCRWDRNARRQPVRRRGACARAPAGREDRRGRQRQRPRPAARPLHAERNARPGLRLRRKSTNRAHRRHRSHGRRHPVRRQDHRHRPDAGRRGRHLRRRAVRRRRLARSRLRPGGAWS